MNDSKLSLFLNCATKELEFGLSFDGKEDRITSDQPKRALEDTNVFLDALLKRNNTSLKEVRAFYCLLGPGSNTGIRLGLTIPRTIYAFDPTIELYGIGTLDLMLSVAKYAALSDRSGNLFFGRKEGETNIVEKVEKKEISSLSLDAPIAVEKADAFALSALEKQQILPVDILSLMEEHRDRFDDYSKREEEFLPRYLFEI